MDETKLTWIRSNKILDEHKDLLIGQIYVWFITSDLQLAIVGKGEKWQFPGGKPEDGETIEESMSREIHEEAGIKLEDYEKEPEMFGYYLTENDPGEIWKGQTYLKLRFILKVNKISNEIKLSNNEREDDQDTLEEVKFVPLKVLPKHIYWIEGREEYLDVLNLID